MVTADVDGPDGCITGVDIELGGDKEDMVAGSWLEYDSRVCSGCKPVRLAGWW